MLVVVNRAQTALVALVVACAFVEELSRFSGLCLMLLVYWLCCQGPSLVVDLRKMDRVQVVARVSALTLLLGLAVELLSPSGPELFWRRTGSVILVVAPVALLYQERATRAGLVESLDGISGKKISLATPTEGPR